MSKTIEQYLSEIREATSASGVYAYRGQGKSKWPLHSAATRRLIDDNYDISSSDFGDQYLKYHREKLIGPARARGFDVENGLKISDLQILAKMQHLGAATGLLDFTWDPLVALWFACENLNHDGKLFIVNTNDPINMTLVSNDDNEQKVETVFSREDTSPRLSYWEPVPSGDATMRILRQRSMFIIGRPLIHEDPEFIKEIKICKEDNISLVKDLNILDVNQSSLFMDLYGLSAAESVESHLSDEKLLEPKDYLRLGNQYYQQSNYSKAIKAYDKCIDQVSNACQPYFSRGNAKAASEDHHGAVSDYDKAIRYKDRPWHNFDPNTSKLCFHPFLFMIYFNRGNSNAQLKNYEAALADYSKAIELVQDGQKQTSLYFNRANVKADMGRFQEAIEDYDEAIKLGSGDAIFNKGNMFVVTARFDEALDCYMKSPPQKMNNSSVEQNKNALNDVITMIAGRKYDFDNSGMPLQVIVQTANMNLKSTVFPFSGRVGNTGNFGMNTSGGKGSPGGLGFAVFVTTRNTSVD